MKRCCYERQRRGPLNHVFECEGGCRTCTLAYHADMAVRGMKEGRTIQAYEHVQDMRILIKDLPNEA